MVSCFTGLAGTWTSYPTVTNLTGPETFLTTTPNPTNNQQISYANLASEIQAGGSATATAASFLSSSNLTVAATNQAVLTANIYAMLISNVLNSKIDLNSGNETNFTLSTSNSITVAGNAALANVITNQTPNTFVQTATNAFNAVTATNVINNGSTPSLFVATVDNGGNDSNIGSQSSPFATVNHAVSVLSGLGGSGSIYIGGGNYTNQIINGSLLKNFHINAQGNAPVKIIEGDPLSTWTLVSGNVYSCPVSGQTSNDVVTLIGRGDPTAANMGMLFEQGTPQGFIDNNQIVPMQIQPSANAQNGWITNRNDNYALLYNTNLVNLTANGEWAYTNSGVGNGGTVYVVFSDGGVPNSRTVYVISTNNFIYNCTGSNEVQVTGIEVDFGNNDFDVSSAAKAEFNGCKASGGYEGIRANQTGVLNIKDSEMQQCYDCAVVTEYGTVFNGAGMYAHDSAREGFAQHYKVVAKITDSVGAFCGINGFVDFGSSGTYNNITTISNGTGYSISAAAQGLGGYKATISNSKFLGDRVASVATSGTNTSVIVKTSNLMPNHGTFYWYYYAYGVTNYAEFDNCIGSGLCSYYLVDPSDSIVFNALTNSYALVSRTNATLIYGTGSPTYVGYADQNGSSPIIGPLTMSGAQDFSTNFVIASTASTITASGGNAYANNLVASSIGVAAGSTFDYLNTYIGDTSISQSSSSTLQDNFIGGFNTGTLGGATIPSMVGDFIWAGHNYATVTNSHSWVMSDGTTSINSLSNNYAHFYYQNGYFLDGGAITGNGGGLTNLSTHGFVYLSHGSNQVSTAAFDTNNLPILTYVSTNGVSAQIFLNPSNWTQNVSFTVYSSSSTDTNPFAWHIIR